MKSSVIFICLLGLVLSLRFYFYYQNRPKYISGTTISLTTLLLNEPKLVKSGQMITINPILIFAPNYPRYAYGDLLKIRGEVSEKEFENKITGEKQKQLVIAKADITSTPEKKLAIPKFFRQRVQDTFQSVLPADEAALMLGILFGFRNNFNASYYDNLRLTGVLHVIAASGTNVTIFAGVIYACLAFFVKRKFALVFTILGVCFYAVLAGLDPPIVRAAIMAIVSFSALCFGRQNYAVLGLFLSSFLMLVYRPELISSVSFQLSFLATFGIVEVKPWIDEGLGIRESNRTENKDSKTDPTSPRLRGAGRTNKKNPILGFFGEDFSTTLSAQITTLPVLALVFGSYSPVSIIVNMLVLWMVTPVMILGGLAAIGSLVWPPLAIPFLYCALPFLLFFKMVVSLFSGVAERTLLPQINLAVILGVYILAGVLWRVFVKRDQSSKIKDQS